MTDMIEALDRKRGKGPQVVRVERVIVHEGGQAIVGNVHAGSPSPRHVSRDAPPQAIDAPGIPLTVEGRGRGNDGKKLQEPHARAGAGERFAALRSAHS